MSLTQLHEVPLRKMILLVGSPGTGKSTFCHKVVLQNLAIERPVIFITTDYDPNEADKFLKDRGMGETQPGLLNYVDAYSETVGLSVPDRPDTIRANCGNLVSIGIAISKLQKRIEKQGSLLVFDSLTSPYLLNGVKVVQFFRLTLSRFAGQGNSVLSCFDEGSSKEEDLVGMKSFSNGIIEMKIEEGNRVFNVLKHPKMDPTRIVVPMTIKPTPICWLYDTEYQKQLVEIAMRGFKTTTLRQGAGDYVNIAWRNLIIWSGMLWDPKRFPTIMYELSKYSDNPKKYGIDMLSFLPWYRRLLFNLLMPKNLSKPKDMKKFIEYGMEQFESGHIGILEYNSDNSTTDEHYLRLFESYECWGLENVGAALAFMRAAMIAGILNDFEKEETDWNVVETKCLGMGNPYCEYKIFPGETDELEDFLTKDRIVIEKINDRIMDHLLGFLLHGKPLMKRPTLGSNVHIHELQHVTAAPTVVDKLQIVYRMGGTKSGKMLGEHLIDSGLKEQVAQRRVINLLEHCNVGKITMNETIKIRENCEIFGRKTTDPSCFFTTGFFNGFFYAIKNQHVEEIKCIGVGDPYCEWAFR
jgi:predicted hydrocarbon binding protein/KaiC/GvpD/RAD55 family RecA-like ATPase